jgi:hypothetical protein
MYFFNKYIIIINNYVTYSTFMLQMGWKSYNCFEGEQIAVNNYVFHLVNIVCH